MTRRSLIILVVLISLAGASLAAPAVKKAKTAAVRTTGISVEAARKTVTAEAKKAPPVTPVTVGPESRYLLEGGFAGGGAILGLGYEKKLNEKSKVGVGANYGLGKGYSFASVDLVRLTYDLGRFTVGAGADYTMYSQPVTNIPGISGMITNKNLFAGDLWLQGEIGGLLTRLGYSTALGLRLSAAYGFNLDLKVTAEQ
jgi:hypothetical protein